MNTMQISPVVRIAATSIPPQEFYNFYVSLFGLNNPVFNPSKAATSQLSTLAFNDQYASCVWENDTLTHETGSGRVLSYSTRTNEFTFEAKYRPSLYFASKVLQGVIPWTGQLLDGGRDENGEKYTPTIVTVTMV